MYSDEERIGSNCSGVKGKKKLDPLKLKQIKALRISNLRNERKRRGIYVEKMLGCN